MWALGREYGPWWSGRASGKKRPESPEEAPRARTRQERALQEGANGGAILGTVVFPYSMCHLWSSVSTLPLQGGLSARWHPRWG